MNEPKTNIAHVRQRIDEIDNALLTLLLERLDCAKEIGRFKAASDLPPWDPQRELAIYARLLEANSGKFPEEALRGIFHEIITACRSVQKKNEVAFLGPEGTFSHLAGMRHFGAGAHYRPAETIEDVFNEVEKERVQHGVVPVENSTEGSVFWTLDSFMKYKVKICGELQLLIRNNLVCSSGRIEDIQAVASHPQPLAHCREWLRKNLPGIPTLPMSSTTAAAQMAAENPNVGAIVGDLAVKMYAVQVAVPGIEDYQGNTTRFLIIGDHSHSRSGSDKTSLLLGLADKPGSLNEVLTLFSDKGINLTKIESRPMKGKRWQYLFFMDLIGHIEDPVIQEGCEAVRKVCSYYEWLGSYPKAADPETEI
ncbi:Bifunctional chorismate mutase/prephenate dehydratase [Candidatus Electronema halotolerans]